MIVNQQPINFYKHLVEQVKDYAIFMLDPQGNILTWNEGARRLKGWEGKEILGHHFSAFYSREDRESDKPAYALRMALELGRYENEGWRVRKDGTRFWADVIITPLRNAEDELIGFAKITRDLTARKLQEDQFQKLLESEEKFRFLVEQVKDYAIFMMDPRGFITSWNEGAQRVKGYTGAEAIGQHFSVFYTPEDKASGKAEREMAQAIREGRYQEEGWRVRKDGTLFWASIVITALWDKRGNLTGFAKVTRDLTLRMRQEEALRERTRELEAFAQSVSHDLRAPLRSLAGYAEVVVEDFGQKLEPEVLRLLERMKLNVSSMDHMLQDILKYSRVITAPFEIGPVPLAQVMEEVLSTFAPEIRKCGAEVSVSPDLPVVQGNHTLLLQVFSNLLSNALKYVPQGKPPQVQITWEQQGAEICLMVRDNGVGITQADQERMFLVFERLASSAVVPGAGVGLAIVKRAVERLGGSIEVRSVVNDGTEFRLRLLLPIENPQAAPQPQG